MTLSPPKPEPLYCLSLRQGTVTSGRYSGTHVHNYLHELCNILCVACVCVGCCSWLAKSETNVVLLDCKCFGYEHIFLGVYQKFGMKVSYLDVTEGWRQLELR